MWDHHALHTRTGWQPGASSRLLAPESLGGKVHNLVLTTNGTLRAIVGPVEYHPSAYEDNGGTVPASVDYATPHRGIFHAMVAGKSVLLAHFNKEGTDNAIWIHEGWSPRWRKLVTDVLLEYTTFEGTGANVYAQFPESKEGPGFNTQFVSTPVGVVIVPQGNRAYMTDGEIIYPLGYDRAPGPPTAHGPELGIYHEGDAELEGVSGDLAPKDAADAPNKGGYSHNGRVWPEVFGTCRVGSVRNDTLDVTNSSEKKSNSAGGILETGEWRCAQQWADLWGNLSPYSGLSSPITIRKEDNLIQDKKKLEPESSERLKMQGAWGALTVGPSGTVGRNLARTTDTLNSGIAGKFVLPNDAAVGRFSSYTIPDNGCEIFPDNVPDSWLQLPATEVDPMPVFRLAEVFDGRLWIARTDAEPNMFRASLPGRYGTLPKDKDKFYADYSGEGITGMHAVAEGMLVFTETAVFMVYPNIGTSGYQTRTLRKGSGCVAPNSIATLTNGMTVWLGREGFYAYQNGKVTGEISGEIKEDTIKLINHGHRARACAAVDTSMSEYRCWVPVKGSKVNNHCVVFDGTNFRSRDDVHAQAVCVTQDTRQLMLTLGSVDTGGGNRHNSVWVMDREGGGAEVPVPHEAIFETVWLRNSRSHRTADPVNVSFWLRETRDSTLTFESFRNGRMHPALQTETTVERSATDTWTPFWDVTPTDTQHEETEYGDYLDNYWTARRPFWRKVDVHMSSTETARFRLSGAGDWELITVTYSEIDNPAGGSKLATGGPF